MLKGQLYKGMNSRRLGHLEATLEVAFYMLCTYPFEIDPGKGICWGEKGVVEILFVTVRNQIKSK